MPTQKMSPQRAQRVAREKAGQRCTACGMTNREHLILTGRSLHSHREDAAGGYTLENIRVLCVWCHRRQHGNTRVCRIHRKLDFFSSKCISEFPPHLFIPKDEWDEFCAIAKRLQWTTGEALIAAMALFRCEAEKELGDIE